MERRLRSALERPEVFLRVLRNAERGQKGDVEVPRREAEGRAAIVAHYTHDIIGAELFTGAAHAFGAMVIGGDRERPAAEQTIVVAQQLSRRFGGAKRIEALIDRCVYAQKAPAGRAHELPQAGGADLGVRRRIERGFHVRQRRDLRRQSEIRQYLGDMRLPGTCTHESGAEPIALTQLKAHVVDGLGESGGRGVCAPELQYVALLVIGRRRASGQVTQDVLHVTAFRIDAQHALVRRSVGIEADLRVHHREPVLIVYEALVGRDLAIDADPELHVRFEFRRSGQHHRVGEDERRENQQGQRQ